MTNIRSFQNVDLPALVEIWAQHWSSIGPEPRVTVARLEQAILARTFFDPETLWVSEDAGRVVAWCHAMRGDAEDELTIAAICLGDRADDSAGQTLLAHALEQSKQAGIQKMNAGIACDDTFGYAGFEPIGPGNGISGSEFRVQALLQQAGFEPQNTFVLFAAATDQYRPPVSREALQLRRATKTSMTVVMPRSIRRASALSHLDIEKYQLLDRSGNALAELDFWFSDPEAEVMSPAISIVDLKGRDKLDASESYLMANVLQSLAARSIVRVEVVIENEHSELKSQLEKCCFQPEGSGIILSRSL